MEANQGVTASKFLIVENDPNDAFLIRRALNNSRCGSSFICRNPSEAKSYLRGAGMYANRSAYPMPDVILTDMRMDGESGLEFIEWIRQQPSPLGEMPIVLLSGSCTPLQLDAAAKVGANKVFQKPLHLADLEELLGRIASEFCSNQKTGHPEIA